MLIFCWCHTHWVHCGGEESVHLLLVTRTLDPLWWGRKCSFVVGDLHTGSIVVGKKVLIFVGATHTGSVVVGSVDFLLVPNRLGPLW